MAFFENATICLSLELIIGSFHARYVLELRVNNWYLIPIKEIKEIAKAAFQACSERYYDLRLKQSKKTKYVIYILCNYYFFHAPQI